MRPYRIALIAAGTLLLAFGAFRLLTQLDHSDLFALAAWMIVAVLLHDGVIAPLTVGAGLLLTHVPDRARRYVQGGLIVSALLIVVGVPLIFRRGTQPAQKAILLRNYAGNLAILLGLTVGVTLLVYVVRVLNDGRTADHGPAEDSDDVDREPTA